MNISPNISIIVPVYNGAQTIKKCVRSILAQTYRSFELILIDDGSTDNSVEIISELMRNDSRIRLYQKNNGGASSARNLGIEKARGNYICFCDADDYVLPQWLETFIKNNDNYDLCIQGIIYDYGKQNFENITIGNKTGISQSQLVLNLNEAMVAGYSVVKMFKRDIIIDNGLRFLEEIKFREDEIFILNYISYISSWKSVREGHYVYEVPDWNDKYGVLHSQCAEYIFVALDKIFKGKIPEILVNKEVLNLRGYITVKMLEGKSLSDDVLRIYRYAVAYNSKGLKNFILDYIILKSKKFKWLSTLSIRIIHNICKRKKNYF